MKLTDLENGCWLIEYEGRVLRMGPTQIHGFSMRRPVYVLEGEKRRPRRVGMIFGGNTEGPESLAERIVAEDRKAQDDQQIARMTDGCWVLPLDVGQADS